MTTETVNPIDRAIQEAKERAEASKGEPAIEMTPVKTAGSSVASYQASRAPTLDDLGGGSMSVDAYIKVTEDGLKLGSKPNLIESVVVEIDMSEVTPFSCVRFGDPVRYIKTFDNVNCASGGLWTDEVQKAQMVDPKAQPYTGADISCTLIEDAKDIKGQVVEVEGTRLGHSTAVMTGKSFAAFYKSLKAQGMERETVKVRLSAKACKNAKGQDYGIIVFDLIQE